MFCNYSNYTLNVSIKHPWHEQQYQISTCNAHVTCNKLVQLVTVKMAGQKQATLNLFISRPTKNIDVPGDDEVTHHYLDDSIQDESPEVPAITDPILQVVHIYAQPSVVIIT